MKLEPRDPKKVYIHVEHLAVIGVLLIVVTLLSATLSILSYFK